MCFSILCFVSRMKLGMLMFLKFFEHRGGGGAGTPFLVVLFLVWVAAIRVVGERLVPPTTATPRCRFAMLLDEEFFGTAAGPKTERGRSLYRRSIRTTAVT